MDQKDLELLMEYQSLDRKASRYEEALKKSPARASLIKAQKYLVNVQNSLKQIESQTAALQATKLEQTEKFNSLKEEYSQIQAEISSGGENLPLEEVSSLRGSLQDVYRELGEIMQKLKTVMEELGAMDEKVRKMAANIPKAKADYTSYKAAYDAEVEKSKADAAPFFKKMEELSASIPEALLAKYKSVRRNHTQPLAAFKDGRCMGCNMELSVALLNRMNSQDITECENCGRILYTEN